MQSTHFHTLDNSNEKFNFTKLIDSLIQSLDISNLQKEKDRKISILTEVITDILRQIKFSDDLKFRTYGNSNYFKSFELRGVDYMYFSQVQEIELDIYCFYFLHLVSYFL